MSAERPPVFGGAQLREATDARLVFLPAVHLRPVKMLALAALLSALVPAVAVALLSQGSASRSVSALAFFGCLPAGMAWSYVATLALWFSPFRPLVTPLVVHAGPDVVMELGPESIASASRGLYFLESHGAINALVLRVGRRFVSVAHFFNSGAGGRTDWEGLGQWREARLALERGDGRIDQAWPAQSLVPVVHGLIRVLRLGPQQVTGRLPSMRTSTFLAWIFAMFFCIGLRIASTLWFISNVDAVARVLPLPPGGPLGLVFGLVSLLPDVVLMTVILKHFWLEPLERQAQAWLEE